MAITMKQFLSGLTIRQKIRLGFGVVWIALAIITIQAVVNLSMVRWNISEVIEDKQPVMQKVMAMSQDLERSTNLLSQSLLLQEPALLSTYAQKLQAFETHLIDLQANSIHSSLGDALTQNFANLQQDIHLLKAKVSTIEDLQSKYSNNYPAFQISNQQLLPLATALQETLREMVESEVEEVSGERQEILSLTIELQKTWLNVMSGLRGYMAFRTDEMSDMTEGYLDLMELNLVKILEFPEKHPEIELTFIEEAAIPAAVKLYQEYRETYMLLKSVHSGEKWRMDTWMMEHELQPVFDHIQLNLESIVTSYSQDMQQQGEALVSSSFWNIVLLLAFSAFGQLFAMWISGRITHEVVDPIHQVSEVMADIAKGHGDLTRRLPVRSQDEIGQMAEHFNQFISRIQKTLAQVQATVENLETASAHLSGVTQSMSHGAQQQLDASSSLNSSMREMRQQSREVETHSQNTSRATGQAADRVSNSSAQVVSAVDEIKKVSTNMNLMAEAVMQLRKDSEMIGSVVSVIREIAEQTNMLSLNAAIEAARAGEHGRGFAVVADEVRALAMRTQESTLQIQRVIQNICQTTQNTVSVVEQGQEVTKHSAEVIYESKNTIGPVTVLMQDINQMSEKVLAAAHSQTLLAEQINMSLQQIHEVAENTFSGVQKTDNAAHNLQNLAHQLDGLVRQFKI